MIGGVYNQKHIGNATYIKGVMGMKQGKNIFFPVRNKPISLTRVMD